MTNELTIHNEMTDAEINSMLGLVEAPQTNYVRIPRLQINTKPKEGKKNLPMGAFFLDEGADTPRFYADEITIRVAARAYQYIRYDNDAKKVTDESLLVNSYKNRGDADRFLSTSGKVKCGKVSQTVLEKMDNITPEQALIQKEVSLKVIFFLVATFTGKDPLTNEEKVYENVPCIFRKSFGSAREMEEAISNVTKEGRMLFKTPIKLSTEMRQNGGDSGPAFFVPQPEVQDGIDLTRADYDVLNSAVAYIADQNNFVRKKFQLQMQTGAATPGVTLNQTSAGATVQATVRGSSPTPNDLDDEIPF